MHHHRVVLRQLEVTAAAFQDFPVPSAQLAQRFKVVRRQLHATRIEYASALGDYAKALSIWRAVVA